VNRAPERFDTARLTARRVGSDDRPFLVALFADERVTRTLGGPRDETRVRDDVDRWNRHWDEHGFGLWILRLRADDEPVGWTMLHTTTTGGPGVEVGWTVAADHWRQGYAAEAATAAVAIGFDDVGLHRIVAFTLVDNVASRGVMEKLGFRYDGEVEHAGLPHVLYGTDRENWERRTHG
jgi:[ribosomal protein S5]-alanine N-acetyltransferase